MTKDKKSKKKITKLTEEVEQLKTRLGLDNEMCKLINDTRDLNLQRTEFHLGQVKETTGEILMEDVTYCVHLSKRIIDHLNKSKAEDSYVAE